MKKIIIILFFIASASAYAQQQQSKSNLTIGVREAIDMGLKNRYDVQSKKYNLAIADNRISKSKKEWIPDITGSGNMRYSPQLQGTYIPAHFFGPNAAIVALGAKSTAIFGLDLNQNIYKPGITTDVKIAKNSLALEQEKNKQDENRIRQDRTG